MKIPLPKGKYVKGIEINDSDLQITFLPKKKIALTFISVNERYWPYLHQVILDCQKLFMPHHQVDYFVWTDMPLTDTPQYQERLNQLAPNSEYIKGARGPNQWWPREVIEDTVKFLRDTKNIKLIETEPIDWPAPTLMRYHLFLQEEEALKGYDYVFYLDADMRVVSKISDEILGETLTAAEHPMYSLRKEYIPPYEPNPNSTAYISRPGQIVVDETGRQRFKPYYYAGGFQGGVAKDWIKAMKVMKANIDKDFNNNYTAIWNDESHWNKYLSTYKKHLVVLPPSYIYPDSLIKEYYEPIWGRSYEPKIITITKPFSLSKEGAAEINQFLGKKSESLAECPVCKDKFEVPGSKILRVVKCPGQGRAHQLDTQPL